MNGILAALDDGYSGVKAMAFAKLADYDAKDLKALPKQSEEIGKRAIALVNNSEEDSFLRMRAAEALGSLKQLNLSELFILIDRTYDRSSSDFYDMRFASYFYGRGDSEIKTLLKWIGLPKVLPNPNKFTYEELRKALEVFKKSWEPSRDFPQPRNDLAKAIANVTNRGKWKLSDLAILNTHYQNLSKDYPTEAGSVQAAINSVESWKWFLTARNTIAAHIAFWLALIFAYPKFPQVQAIFFWNPWVRRILGVGYVGFLLTWVPFLRRKLFEPFKFSLLADAGLDRFNTQAYFPESEVSLLGSTDTFPIHTAIPSIKGQIVLEGDSGLGKSMFLRHLVNHSKRIVVFLPARKCENGVIEAIQAKLHGQVQDAEFLKNLIYSGAIDICIDGLNEVTADTRAKITQFVESYFKGNIIMTTQPLEWIPPSTAKVYQLHSLRTDQIETFLLSRKNSIAPTSNSNIPQNNGSDAISNNTIPSKSENVPSKSGNTPISTSNDPSKNSNDAISNNNDRAKNSNDAIVNSNYPEFCRTYLTQSLNPAQSPEELAAAQRILSNPMDLTVVAQMLALGETPNLLQLQEQQYTLMSADYQQRWNQDFPLKKFSEAVYQLRLNDEKALPATEFHPELLSMEDEKYKMVVSRQWKDAKGEAQHEWYFRHDKIAEFFIVQTFLGDGEDVKARLVDRLGDPRFRGVYFLLATRLPLDDAKELRETLIQYAADTKDHTVSDEFVQLLRIRPKQEAIHQES